MSKKRKIYNPLRLIRQSVAVICLLLFVVAFADWGNGTPTIDQLHTIASALAGWQFVPAILSVSGTTIVLLLLLTCSLDASIAPFYVRSEWRKML